MLHRVARRVGGVRRLFQTRHRFSRSGRVDAGCNLRSAPFARAFSQESGSVGAEKRGGNFGSSRAAAGGFDNSSNEHNNGNGGGDDDMLLQEIDAELSDFGCTGMFDLWEPAKPNRYLGVREFNDPEPDEEAGARKRGKGAAHRVDLQMVDELEEMDFDKVDDDDLGSFIREQQAAVFRQQFDEDEADDRNTANKSFGGQGGKAPPRSRRMRETFILDDYIESFRAAAPTRSTDAEGPVKQNYGDGVTMSDSFVDARAKRIKGVKLYPSKMSGKGAATPLMWFDKFSRPTEKNRWIMREITRSRVSNMTAKGKSPSIKTLIVIGNGDGAAGYGVGKGKTFQNALNRAVINATKNLIYLDFKDRTGIYEPLKGKHNNTKAFMWPMPRDAGHRVGGTMRAVCECIGLYDVTGRIVGRNNPYSVIQAIFDCFQGFRTIEEASVLRGRRLFDLANVNPRYSRDPYKT